MLDGKGSDGDRAMDIREPRPQGIWSEWLVPALAKLSCLSMMANWDFLPGLAFSGALRVWKLELFARMTAVCWGY